MTEALPTTRLSPGDPPDETKSTGTRRFFHRYVATVIVAIAAALLLRAFVIHAYRIPSASMEDTLLVGDFLLAERISFGANVELPWARSTGIRLPALRSPRAGEVVVFRRWDDGAADYIKRCVGLPGDTVAVVENTLVVNGRPFDPFLAIVTGGDARVKHIGNPHDVYRHFTDRLRNFGPHVVPPGHIFVVGDNRDNSDDSRLKGDVPIDALRGSPMFIYWSVDSDAPWWDVIRRVRWGRIGKLVR